MALSLLFPKLRDAFFAEMGGKPTTPTRPTKKLNKFLSTVSCSTNDIETVEIVALKPNGKCYNNCYDYAKKNPKYQVVIGWTIWCYNRHELYEIEHHAILWDTENKKYLDITTPTDGEKKIWWVEDKDPRTNSIDSIIEQISLGIWKPIVGKCSADVLDDFLGDCEDKKDKKDYKDEKDLTEFKTKLNSVIDLRELKRLLSSFPDPITPSIITPKLIDFLRSVSCSPDDIKVVKVLPTRKSCLCYENCYDYAKIDPKFQVEIGYIIWSYDRLDLWELVHHAILWDSLKKEYLDITAPPNDEKEIWWVKDKDPSTNSIDIMLKIISSGMTFSFDKISHDVFMNRKDSKMTIPKEKKDYKSDADKKKKKRRKHRK